MKVADTSFLFTVFDRQDPRHADASRRLQESPVVIPTEVLVELVGALGHKVGRRAAKEALEALVEQKNVVVEGSLDAGRALALYRKHAPLSLVDACVVATCQQEACGVLAYDERIEALVGE